MMVRDLRLEPPPAKAWREAAHQETVLDTLFLRVREGSRPSLATSGSDRHSKITFRTDELTDGGGQVKGNRGQFPRFTAKYCKLPC